MAARTAPDAPTTAEPEWRIRSAGPPEHGHHLPDAASIPRRRHPCPDAAGLPVVTVSRWAGAASERCWLFDRRELG